MKRESRACGLHKRHIQYVALMTVPNNLSKAFLADDLDINKPACSLGSNKKIKVQDWEHVISFEKKTEETVFFC